MFFTVPACVPIIRKLIKKIIKFKFKKIINKYFSKQNGKRPQPNRAIVVCARKDIDKKINKK